MACADVVTAKAKTTAINLIILSSLLHTFKKSVARSMLIW